MKMNVSKAAAFDPSKSGSLDLPDGFYAVKINEGLVAKKDKNGHLGLAVQCEVTEPGKCEGWKQSVYLNLVSEQEIDQKKILSAALAAGYPEGEELDTDDLAEFLSGKDSIIMVKAQKKTNPKTGEPYRANVVFVTAEDREKLEGKAAARAEPVKEEKKPSLKDRLAANKK
jgi:hypothetical protein